MGRSVHSHTEWCVVRFFNGRFERVREGYKSAANARKAIPFAVKEHIAEHGNRSAIFAVAKYTVGEAVVQTDFTRCCA